MTRDDTRAGDSAAIELQRKAAKGGVIRAHVSPLLHLALAARQTDQMTDRQKVPWKLAVPWGLLAASALLPASLMIVVVSRRPLTPLEAALFQVLIMVLGFVGTFMLGRVAAKSAAMENTRVVAGGALRRVVTLYRSLQSLAVVIEDRRKFLRHQSNDGHVPAAHVEAALDHIFSQASIQLLAAGDAVEDWRALVPEAVEEIEQAAHEGRKGE